MSDADFYQSHQAFFAVFSIENAELSANILPKSGQINTVPGFAVVAEKFDAVTLQLVPSINSTVSPDKPRKLYGFFRLDLKQEIWLESVFWQ